MAYDVDGGDFRISCGALFEALRRPKSCGKNQLIYQQGDTAEFVYYLKSGKVKVYIAGPDGSEKTLTVMTAGSLFGKSSFFDGTARTSSAKTLAQSEIIAVDKRMMAEAFRQEPDFALELLTYLSGTIRILSLAIDGLAFMPADRRLARFLLANRNAGDGSVACTHEDIGSRTGLSRVTVSRILSRFKKEGWIETAYRRIVVLEPGALEE